jgi:hypothetical protein
MDERRDGKSKKTDDSRLAPWKDRSLRDSTPDGIQIDRNAGHASKAWIPMRENRLPNSKAIEQRIRQKEKDFWHIETIEEGRQIECSVEFAVPTRPPADRTDETRKSEP